MENPDSSSKFTNFVIQVVMISIALVLVAIIIALTVNLNFMIILFGLGIFSIVTGAYLGGANPFDPRNPRISHGNPYEYPSAEKLRARIIYVIKNSVPLYSIENAFVLAGLLVLVSSLPFICQIMF